MHNIKDIRLNSENFINLLRRRKSSVNIKELLLLDKNNRDLIQKKRILEDALAVSNSGVFAMVIECVVEDLAKMITNNVSVPTIGIGASKHCDGQILVIDDMLGLTDTVPRFVKRYTNLKKIIEFLCP